MPQYFENWVRVLRLHTKPFRLKSYIIRNERPKKEFRPIELARTATFEADRKLTLR